MGEVRETYSWFGLEPTLTFGTRPEKALGDEQTWRETEAQISEEMLASSLPHRSPQERRTLAEGFLGVTTWQRVCSEFDLLLPDER